MKIYTSCKKMLHKNQCLLKLEFREYICVHQKRQCVLGKFSFLYLMLLEEMMSL